MLPERLDDAIFDPVNHVIGWHLDVQHVDTWDVITTKLMNSTGVADVGRDST